MERPKKCKNEMSILKFFFVLFSDFSLLWQREPGGKVIRTPQQEVNSPARTVTRLKMQFFSIDCYLKSSKLSIITFYSMKPSLIYYCHQKRTQVLFGIFNPGFCIHL